MTHRLSESEARRLVTEFTLSEVEWLTSRYEGQTEGRSLADLYRELCRYGVVDTATRATVKRHYFFTLDAIKYRCRVCGSIWDESQTLRDPMFTADVRTCGDLFCGGTCDKVKPSA